MADAEKCNTCFFYRVDHGQNGFSGYCHRHGPHLGRNGYSQWPNVKMSDWCGEWKEISANKETGEKLDND